MEYTFRIADLFSTQVSIVGNDLIPVNCPGINKIGTQKVIQNVSQVLDSMGKASAQAQKLSTVITTGEKLRISNHRVYIMSDLETNSVVGILKVGEKKLYVYDQSGVQHEINPLCILDFYVYGALQRQGRGKFLFDYMLRQEGIPVEHFAIDGPTDMFLAFVAKHYGETKMIPQLYNFALFDGFFKDRADYIEKKAAWNGVGQALERPKKHAQTVLEDSRNYNSHASMHLRNGQQLPNYVSNKYDTAANNSRQITQPWP